MHWTYENVSPDDDLCQGDILEPTEDLKNLFNEVHPHFTHPKYRRFFILTQTCDLVQRKEKSNTCSATHINLSVVRSLHDVIRDSLKNHFGYLAPGIYSEHMKRSVQMMIERLVNQNEIALGLFYLHPDADAGITVPSVAILRVAISVRATEHYQTLQGARVGKLSKEFQPKLGWMVGNLFSRVGVRDWKEETENEEERMINDILCFSRKKPLWINHKMYKKILKERPDFDTFSVNEQEEVIKTFLPPPAKEKAIAIIAKTIKNVVPKIPEAEIEKITSRLINDQQLEAQMRKFGK
ncbi:MAG: hypothetical protein JRI62_07025 [Deltaproteobacteria bacterium]|nr:hypothetical protein [Deltaproteobacteria bacterium]